MHLSYVYKVAYYSQYSLLFIYRLFLPLMLYVFLFLSFYSTPTSDPHTTWIDLTFSTCLRTQLQTLYSDALSDTVLLYQNPLLPAQIS